MEAKWNDDASIAVRVHGPRPRHFHANDLPSSSPSQIHPRYVQYTGVAIVDALTTCILTSLRSYMYNPYMYNPYILTSIILTASIANSLRTKNIFVICISLFLKRICNSLRSCYLLIFLRSISFKGILDATVAINNISRFESE